jgi:hypothetical protein
MPSNPNASADGTIDVDRGLLIVRYVSAEDQDFPPRIEISAAPRSADEICIVLHPDAAEPVLWEPGAALVVQAVKKGQLIVGAIAARANSSTAAVVRIHPLSQGHPSIDVETSATQPIAQGADDQAARDLRLMGHLAGRGDVFAHANDWIAGPAAPARIEGIAIEWPGRPKGVDIRYAVTAANGSSVATTLTDPGTFVGTRGQSLPLVSLSLELEGPAACRFEFTAEVLFLDASPVSAVGLQLQLAGPTGREPLVGLRLGIQPALVSHARQGLQAPSPGKASAKRVRVFRPSEAKPS